MRLTCPNCGAQYEVPDEVIPADGRDVQCSNCGHTWYQDHPAHPARMFDTEEEIEEAGVTRSEEELRAALTGEEPEEPEYEAEPADEPEPEPELVAAGEDAFYAESLPEEEEEPEALPSAPARHALDDAVSDILREEAEREARLRAAEAGGVETQPELGLESYDHDDAEHRARQARERMTRLRYDDQEEEEAQPASRRDLLPDIEEINSTLRANGGGRLAAGDVAVETEEAAQRSGMMRGFSLAVLIGAALLLIYGNAPRIARSVPQADPMLSAYVAMVDQARYWLDAKLGGFSAD